MKTILLTVLIVVTSICSYAQEYGKISELDTKNGFKTLVLGDTLKELTKFKHLGDVDENVKMYDAIGIDKKIGDITLESVSIISFHNKISTIVVYFDKKDGYKIHDVFSKAYGLYSERPNRFMDKYEWYGKNVRLILDYDDTRKEGSIMFISEPLLKLQRQEDNNKSKKAISDL